MKAAWVTIYDSLDRSRDYGARGYFQSLSLSEQSMAVEHIGCLQISPLHQIWLRAKRRLLYIDNPFTNRWLSIERDPKIYQHYARQISKRLSELNSVDVVCSGISPYSQPIAYLECPQPIVIWTDAPFVSALDFYPDYFRNVIAAESIRHGIANERSALQRSSLIIYWSDWAAQIAINYYQLDPSRVKVVPVGSNFECSRTFEDIQMIVNSRPSDRCRLLFVGIDWFRKGGDICLQVAEALNRAGLPTELLVVGCSPVVDEPLPHFVHPLGYLNSGSAEGLKQLHHLFASSHFLMMPSIAESFGQVFCEASSFGLPSLASQVGGIPTAVRDGLNGQTFPRNTPIEDYCNYVLNLFSHYSEYKELALSSFREYESRLNWTTAGRSVRQLLAEQLN